MAYGIAGVMNMNMFGIPMSGPTACGFFGATKEDEMCGRWIQLSSMLPLARQHRAPGSEGGPANEPYTLTAPYDQWAKNALMSRLQYVRHIYTCLFETNQEGGSCVDPLFFHFPDDIRTFDPSQTENSFILGNALKVTPVVEAKAGTGAQMVRTYFPKGQWVDMRDFSQIKGSLTAGLWAEVAAPETATETIITHLREGYMIPYQPQDPTTPFMTTKDVLARAELHLVANPNPDGWAQGRLFMDGGEKLSELENGDYEYYQFHLSAGSLKKWVLNDRALEQAGRGLDSLTIVNAETHANTDFACWISNDETVSAVDFKYDAAKVSLTLTDPNGPIDLYKLRNLYYGNSAHDQNLCFGILGHEKQYYKVKGGGTPDLTGTAPLVIELENNAPGGHPDLNLTLTVTEASIVNIRWNYADKPETVKTPYEVPTNIVNMDLKPGHLPLSDFITWSTHTGNNTGEFQITVKNYLEKDALEPLFTLRSNMMLNQYLNSWEGTAELRRDPDFQGLMGLPDQTSTDLFLGNGTYSLWNREAAEPVETGKYPTENTYGSVPFVMGAASNHTWMGLYSNVAAAQDWEIKNFQERGVVDIAFFAVGGRGDISILQGHGPN